MIRLSILLICGVESVMRKTQHFQTNSIRNLKMSNFRRVDPPCGRPDPKWWKKSCCPPTFRSVHRGEFKIVAVDQLVNENNEGQKLNPARSQGIDWVNVATISNSFLVKGFVITSMSSYLKRSETHIMGR